MTTQEIGIETTIEHVLDKHKPAGARWVVLVTEMQGFKSTHGPFDGYDEAQAWLTPHLSLPSNASTNFEVIPLYVK